MNGARHWEIKFYAKSCYIMEMGKVKWDPHVGQYIISIEKDYQDLGILCKGESHSNIIEENRITAVK